MSFRINYNSSAIGTQSNLTGIQTDLDRSIRRLSSGLKMSKPQDSVTEFIGAEAIRSQLKAYEQSSRNNQDAINVSKMLDSALSEVNRLLSGARAIAVSSGNTGTTSTAQLASNQSEIRRILESIDRVAEGTRWGETRLLDGSAGAAVSGTNSSLVEQLGFRGVFNGFPVTSGLVTATQTAIATQAALINDVNYGSATAILPAGTVTINGYSFVADGIQDTVQSMMDQINNLAVQTGVHARLNGGVVELWAQEFGSQSRISLYDPNGIFSTTANPAQTTTGVDAVLDAQITTENGVQTVQFRGGRQSGDHGLLLTDAEGNTIRLNPLGNGSPALASGANIGTVSTGNATRFQLGSLPTDITALGLPDIRTTQLASGVVGTLRLSDIDVSSTGGATLAIQVLDAAIEEISSIRANIGSFQRHTLESWQRDLNIRTENLSATESDLRDLDVALEMTEFTRLQVMQQASVSILSQANQMPEQVLNLLR